MSGLSQVLTTVIPLAIASMVSPLAIITVITVLSAGSNRAKKGVLFVSTYFLTFAVICIIFLAIGSATTSGGMPSLTTASIDIILGILLLYASARSLLKKGETKTFDPSTMGATAIASMGAFFGVGNIFSSLPALAASKDIGVAVISPLDKAIAFVITMVIALCWSWVPLAIYIASPKNFDRYLNPVTGWLRKHGGQLIAAVFLLVGVYLLVRGISDLTALQIV
ncbi:MAG: GAP family protein [Halobacteriota archaeon]